MATLFYKFFYVPRIFILSGKETGMRKKMFLYICDVYVMTVV